MQACSQRLCNKTRPGETKGALEHLLRPDDKWSSDMIVWRKWRFNVSAEPLRWQWGWGWWWWWCDDDGLRMSAEVQSFDESDGTRDSHWPRLDPSHQRGSQSLMVHNYGIQQPNLLWKAYLEHGGVHLASWEVCEGELRTEQPLSWMAALCEPVSTQGCQIIIKKP